MKEKLEIIIDMKAPLKAIKIRKYTPEHKGLEIRIEK